MIETSKHEMVTVHRYDWSKAAFNPIYTVSTGHGNLGITMGRKIPRQEQPGKTYDGELQIIPDTLQPDCVMIMMWEGRTDPNVCVENDLFVVTVTHYTLHISEWVHNDLS